jgi:ribosome recycling factor
MSDDPVQDSLDEARKGMKSALEHLRQELRSIRTGRASPAMLQNVKVDYYGSQTPLEQIASISAPQADLLLVQPYDQNALSDIEKGIMKANLGLNPSNDGQQIRVPIPPLSEERRKDLVRKTHEIAEETRISMRNTRRDAKNKIKKIVDNENLSEDVRYGAEEELDELTQEFTEKVDDLLDQKEEDIMKV